MRKGALLLTTIILAAGCSEQPDSIPLPENFVTKAALDQMGDADIPEKWRSRSEEAVTEASRATIHYRGDRRRLVVARPIAQTENDQLSFHGTIYDDETVIGRIFRVPGSEEFTISAPDPTTGYKQLVSVDHGKATVVLTRTNGFLEIIQVSTNGAAPMNDLEYTRAAMVMERNVNPFLELLKKEMTPAPLENKAER